MKKLVCFVLVLALLPLFSCCSGAQKGKEITFQDIPWGSTREETLQRLVDSGFISESTMESRLAYHHHGLMLSYLSEKDGISTDLISDDFIRIGDSFYFSKKDILEEKKKIAGYQVDSVAFWFACDERDSALLMAVVELAAVDVEGALLDLTTKLTSLYGERLDAVADGEPCSAWKGANHTAVMLAPDSNPDSDLVVIVYGTLDTEKILNEYHAGHQPAPTYLVDPNDLSGL